MFIYRTTVNKDDCYKFASVVAADATSKDPIVRGGVASARSMITEVTGTRQ